MQGLIKKYKNMSVLARSSFWFVICSCTQSGIKFISLPVFANIMSVSDYGTVTVYASWFSFIFVFATLSLGSSNGVFYVAMSRFKKENDLFTTAMCGLTVVLCTICFFVIYVSTFFLGDWMQIGLNQYFAMYIELIGYGVMLLYSLKMRYDNNYKELLLITFMYSIGTTFFSVIAVIACPDNFNQANVKNWSGAMFSLLVGLFALYFILKNNHRLVNLKFWKFAAFFTVPLLPHYLSTIVLVQSDRIMISHIINSAATAIYNVAYTLGVAVQVITLALVNALTPWMYKKLDEKDYNRVSKVVVPILILVSFLVVIVCSIMPEIFNLLFPKDYAQAIKVIPPVAASVIWAFIFNIYASTELYFSGNKLVSCASVTGAIINVIANLIFIPIYGFIAAAYTTLLCNVLYAFMHTIFSNYLVKCNLKRIDILPNHIIWYLGICATLLCFLVCFLYPYTIARYVLISLSILIAAFMKQKILTVFKTFKK